MVKGEGREGMSNDENDTGAHQGWKRHPFAPPRFGAKDIAHSPAPGQAEAGDGGWQKQKTPTHKPGLILQ